MKLLENQGFTNKTYKDEENNLFIKIKSFDSFNHKTDYKLLNKLSFSPEVIENTPEKLVTKWIDGKTLNSESLTNKQLKIIGEHLITLHNSRLPFFKENQIARRFKVYREKIKKLQRKIPILDKYYKKINIFLKSIDTSAPVHNDLWLFNMIENENDIYITDWEYATMGDVHFDLAYFIESSNLNKEQEKIFLDAYGDDFEEKYLLIHKIIVNALIILWVYQHEVLPFETTIYEKRVEKYMNIYLKEYSK
ncbi:phosphotransferase [Metamycoplasma buccale]|uniref:phosphotransferase n=1 Tax=Metamycoplasma buccale TaxID=55602 RepID=UPI00398E41F8